MIGGLLRGGRQGARPDCIQLESRREVMRPGALQAEELLVSGEGVSLLPPGVCKQRHPRQRGGVTCLL